jgi:DNA-binding beta-propeller fold protein YncE
MNVSRLSAAGFAAAIIALSGSFVLSGGSLVAQQAAQQKEIAFESAGDFLTMPADIHLGEVAGVATDPKGNLWVYNQGGGLNLTVGAARLHPSGGARLFQFDRSGKFVTEFGSTNEERPYGFRWAQGVRVDPDGNVWTVDRGSRTIIKFAPDGRILMILGRTPEAIGEVGSSAGGGGGGGGRGGEGRGGGAPGAGAGGPGAGPAPGAGAAPGGGGGGRAGGRGAPGAGTPGDNFNQPTDVAWDAQGNIFVSDGYTNARVAKFDKGGRFARSWGQLGSEPGQFNIPSSIAVDAQGNVYVADMGNKRIQVFDNNGTFKTQFTNVGAPRAICISPGAQQFLYASNSNPTEDPFLDGEIYKMQLDGTIVGRFGRAGKQFKEFGMVNAIDCREPNTLYVAELMNWRVQKLTLK